MDGSEWLKIIVPVALSSCISIIITLVNNKIIKKKMAKKTLIQRRMRELLKHISAIKSAIISIECQLVNFEEGLEKYFISAGDLQVYLEDNKHAMLTEINKKEDIYSIKTIDDLSKKITEVGLLMKTDKSEEFACAFRETKAVCDYLIDKYNCDISKAEYI